MNYKLKADSTTSTHTFDRQRGKQLSTKSDKFIKIRSAKQISISGKEMPATPI